MLEGYREHVLRLDTFWRSDCMWRASERVPTPHIYGSMNEFFFLFQLKLRFLHVELCKFLPSPVVCKRVNFKNTSVGYWLAEYRSD